MKSRLMGLALSVVIAVLQCFIINNVSIEEAEFGFSTICTTLGTDNSIIQRVLFSYLPIPFIIFMAEDVVVFVNIFFIASLLLPIENENTILNCIFLPRLAFATVNGVMDGIDSNPLYLQLYLFSCNVKNGTIY